MTSDRRPDPALVRGLTQPRMSRRQFLRDAGAGAGALGLASILAACGTEGASTSGPKPNAGLGTSAWWEKQQLQHELSFANWAYYIDTTHGTHPSLDRFAKDTGINVDYHEAVNDNNAFFAKIRPDLQEGNYTGFDLVVSPDTAPPVSEMVQLGYAIPLNQDMMKNYYRYSSKLVWSPAF